MRSFEDRWNELHPETDEAVFKRVDGTHPLDFYFGLGALGERILLLVSDKEPPSFPVSQSINVSLAKRNDGRWVLRFCLKRPELGKLFSHLCEDLVESSRSISNINKGASFVLARFNRWQRLLERGFSGLLDEKTLRGLIGELIFLRDVAFPQYGLSKSLKAWCGPNGGDQDFRFDESWYEIKTVQPGASTVMISSVEQLDVEGYKGRLVLIFLEKASSTQKGSFSLYELVNKIRTQLSDAPLAINDFEDKLLQIGYIHGPEYNEKYYIIKSFRKFNVTKEFPILKRADLPVGLVNAKYELSIIAITPFEETTT